MSSKACKSFDFQAFLIFTHSNLYQYKVSGELNSELKNFSVLQLIRTL